MGKILVTGGTGFIGSHTCVALTNAGYSVVVMDNLVNSKVESIARIEMIPGKHIRFYRTDMLDEEGMRQIFNSRPAYCAGLHSPTSGSVQPVMRHSVSAAF